jgi:3-deoxy-D-manno-octulosonic-acid transferase
MRRAGADGASVVTSGDPLESMVLAPPRRRTSRPRKTQGRQAFLDHWRPDAAVFAGDVVNARGDDRGAGKAAFPLYLVDARLPEPSRGGCAGRPAPARRCSATSAASSRRPRAKPRLSAACAPRPTGSRRAGHLEEGTAPLPCNRTDHLALAACSPPARLARHLARGAPDEVEAVLAAHAAPCASRTGFCSSCARRTPRTGPALRDRLEADGWTSALRSDGERARSRGPDLRGRRAGRGGALVPPRARHLPRGSLAPRAGQGHDPCEPAALGSAILVGPADRAVSRPGPALPRRRRRAHSRRGRGAGRGGGRSLAPDRAAEMARRAWEITSAGSPT